MADGGQSVRSPGRDGYAVEPRDRNMIRNDEAVAPKRVHATEGHNVAREEYGVGRVRPAHQPQRGIESGLIGVIAALLDEAVDAVLIQPPHKAALAVHAGGSLKLTSDKGRATMVLAQQEFRHLTAAGDIVAGHRMDL